MKLHFFQLSIQALDIWRFTKIDLEKESATHSSILAWEIKDAKSRNGHKSLVGYSPWACKESYMTQ